MAGLPGVDALSTYGGVKTDYAPTEDASTDESADHRNLYASNVAGMTQTVCRAWACFLGHGTAPTDPPSNVHGAVWGDSLVVKPLFARSSAGVFFVQWPATIVDELGVTHTVNLRRFWVNVEGTVPYFVTATLNTANSVVVRVFNAAGAANDAVGVAFTVYAV